MIESFQHGGLRDLFETGRSRKVWADLARRARRVLDALNAASSLHDLNLPGIRTHPLKGTSRHAISVSAQWRVTFEWHEGAARRVDLEQYH